jgi:probable F420-dependent oxidoreductase
MAAVTTRLRLLTSVLVVPLRDPFLLAKQIGTLAIMSENRFILGTGVGWLREEFETVGRSWDDRGRRMDEMLDVLVDFWTDGYAEYHGTYYNFERSGMFPVPSAPIPIWIGGHSLTAARRAARFDGYMPMMGLDDNTRRQFALVDRLRAEEGRTGAFEKIGPWLGGNDPSHITVLAEGDGITKAVVGPWGFTSRDLPFAKKRAAAEAFADAVIRP